MPKNTSLTDTKARQARAALIRAGAFPEQVAALELAVLQQVQANTSIGGNASDYVNTRIATLEGRTP